MIPYLALAVLSAASLAYEVLLVRLFAIVQWHHFAFMAISVALLGFGASGTLLALVRERAVRHFETVFFAGAVLFGLTGPAAFLLAQALPFNALAVVWAPAQLLYLPLLYLLLAVPFVAAGTCIGLAFLRFGERIGRVYAWNLVGSGVGALGLVAALAALSPSETLRLVAALGFAAAVLVVARRTSLPWRALSGGTVVLGLAVWTLAPDAWFALRISPYKGLPQALEVSGARLLAVRSGPLGLLSVVESPEVPFRYVPGLSLSAPATPPAQLGVFVDGGGFTAITRFDGRLEPLSYLDHTTDALPYHLLDRPSVLVLGAGGGQAVLQAIVEGARGIDAVELDANMAALVARDFADFAGRLYERPEVEVHLAEARAFVSSSRERWDLVQMPLVEAGAAGALGGLGESYLYTVEAFEALLGRLEPGGWLAVTRWLKLPPRDAPRLFATALEALSRSGVEAPEGRLVLLRGINTTTLLVKNGTVSEAEVAKVQAFAVERSFDLAWYPGMAPEVANRFNLLDEPIFYRAARALAGAAEERRAFLEAYKFDIAPASDDRPYFSGFSKWRSLPELLALARAGGPGLLELGGPILAATLLQAAALSALLILAPLGLGRRRLAGGSKGRVLVYFLALGLAFLFIEIAFIQRFILFLGHPLYAVAVVLAAFLVFAGLGSAASPRLAGRASRLSGIQLAVGAILLVSLLYLLALPPLFERFHHLSDAARIAISLALIAPLAFFMGMPFPLGLSRVRASAPALVPWAWGVNGCASVLSVLLATLIALELGFTAVVLAACALYASAAWIFRRPL